MGRQLGYHSGIDQFGEFMGYNNFNGSIDLSSLPSSIQDIWFGNNEFIGGINWDALANLHKLERIQLNHNYLSGPISMSQGLSFTSQQLWLFDVSYNSQWTLQWDIFEGIHKLKYIDMNDNNLNGTINWSIISDLHNNGSLGNCYFIIIISLDS